MTIEVLRSRPPSLAYCREKKCGRLVEWVTTTTGKRMPLDHPPLVERVHERLDGTLVTVIDTSAAHFATCPAAAKFRRTQTRKRNPQGILDFKRASSGDDQ